MRVRSVVLPAVLAVAAAVLAPTSAQAATKCALIAPTKVVVDAPGETTQMRLTSGCSTADYLAWDFDHVGGDVGYSIEFSSEDFAAGITGAELEWDPVDPMGRWNLIPRGATTPGGPGPEQNSAVTQVKYGSKLTTKVTRAGSKLSWAVTATQWSGRAQKNVARPKANVGLFHQAPGSKTWTYVRSVTTSRTGTATVSLAAPKAGSYRLKVAETPTVWAAYSKTVQGRR